MSIAFPWVRGWHLAVFILACVSGLLSRRSLEESAQFESAINVWDQLFVAAIDPYLAVYVIVPFLLFMTLVRADYLCGDIVLLRLGSVWRWSQTIAVASLRDLALPALALLAGAALSSVGLGFSTRWSAFALRLEGDGSAEFATTGLPPAPLFLWAWLCFGAQVWALLVLVRVAYVLVPRGARILIPACLCVSLVFSLSAEWWSIGRGIYPSRVLDEHAWSAMLLPLPAIESMAIAFLVIGWVDYRRGSATLPRSLTLTTMMGIVAIIRSAAVESSSLEGEIYAVFFGVSNPVELASLVFMVLVSLAPVYLVMVDAESEIAMLPYCLLRDGSPGRWMVRILRRTWWFPGYFAAVVIAVAIGFRSDQSMPHDPLSVHIVDLLAQVVLCGTLHAWLVLVICLSVRMAAGRPQASVVVLGVWVSFAFLSGVETAMPVLALSTSRLASAPWWENGMWLAAYCAVAGFCWFAVRRKLVERSLELW